jgi:GTP:adenosylcobinamide-phosphate guanylyltransferase
MARPLPTVLILAGRRQGRVDPLAAAHGVEHKCLVPLLDRPLVGYVLDAVDAAFPGCRIVVSIDDPAALDGVPEAGRLIASGRLTAARSARILLESVIEAVAGAAFPLLVTTGDNVLMTPQALRHFHSFAIGEGVDAAVMFARKQDVLAAHPEGQPRFWEFRDGSFSGCNTYWLKDRRAFTVAEIFRGGGQFLKFPKRFIAAFGLVNLVAFRLRLFTLEGMQARIARRYGKSVKAQIVDDGSLAIDVDTEFTRLVAERMLRARGVSDRSA